ncbi:MAG TPA: methionine synthase [Aeromicrobium sp.]|nr:methionine synthase [Aeromicrobium sp.]
MRATGIGSMPGDDFTDALHTVLGEVGDLPFVPELPERGIHAGMIGRSLAVLDGLHVDLQPAGWRLTTGPSRDHRRVRSRLGQDLDVLEELLPASTPTLKQQVAGPWTLVANVERPRGDRVLADHGARRELAESLAEGLGQHVADLRGRAPHQDVVIQIDEPSLPATLAGAIPTASGYGRHRSVGLPEAEHLLALVAESIAAAGAVPVVHCCAGEVPVALLARAGFKAISFDLALAVPGEDWSRVFEDGVDLWPGGARDSHQLDAWFLDLGFDDAVYGDRTVVSPACGLSGTSPAEARSALRTSQEIASTV